MTAPLIAALFTVAKLWLPILPMALPPLTDNALRSSAGRVVVAEVIGVFQREVPVDGGTNFEHVAQVKPLRDESALARDTKLEPLLYVHYWQAGQRPSGWAGPGGQHASFQPGQTVRLFLRATPTGAWELLEPNGWSKVK